MPPDDAAARWEQARDLWKRRSPRAHAAWTAIDPDTPQGRAARRLLREAEGHYRDGIARLRRGDTNAREALMQGVRRAPMDPALYLPLARACRGRGLELRAGEYYNKYLAAHPDGPEARTARRELRALSPELAGVFDQPPRAASPREQTRPHAASIDPRTSAAAGALGVLWLMAAVAGLLWWRRRRGSSLAETLAHRPELHPTIAYVLGSLRHELLKHRIGAARDAVDALRRRRVTDAQLDFLRSRLGGRGGLREAWDRHVREAQRALGPGVQVGRDPAFRAARHAIRTLDVLAARLPSLRPCDIERLGAAHARLCAFDRALGRMLSALVRTRVDDALLADVVQEVRREHATAAVPLDELRVTPVDEPATVEVFRVDLVLMLKNLLRNAILAVGRADTPRRVALDAAVRIEPTGEETVRLRVRDNSPECIPPHALRFGRVDRGLGLVATAVTRYGGSIDVEAADGTWSKGLTLQFFRADDLGEQAPEDAEARAA